MTYIPRQILTETAFGELAVESKSPQVQVKFPYAIIDDFAQILVNKTGSNAVALSGNAIITAAAVAQSFSQIRTRKILRYGPGQGGLVLSTCIFTQGVANSSQVIGVGDDDQGYFWGYNGTSFGVLRRNTGSLEIKNIVFTAGATTSGNITITLDGSDVVVAVLAGDTIAQVVEKIIAQEPSFLLTTGRGWEAHTHDSIRVEFISLIAEHAVGAFTFTDTDATGVTAGAFTEPVTGVVPTNNWIALDSGDAQVIDPLDGSGPSGFTIDPTKGNVYSIRFQYLGYGAIEYGVENPKTGDFILAVRIQYANANDIPSLVNPDNPLTLIAKTETGYTGGTLVMKTASLAGFSEGLPVVGGLRRSASSIKSITTTEELLLVIHDGLDFNGAVNKRTVIPDLVTFGSDSLKSTIVRIIKQPSRIDAPSALIDVDPGVSVMQFGTVGTNVINGREILVFIIPSASGYILNLVKEELIISPGERLVFTAQHTGGAAADVTMSVGWTEGV